MKQVLKSALFLSLLMVYLPATVLSQKLAIMDVEVRDRRGHIVADLTWHDFFIYENGESLVLHSWERRESTDSHPRTYYRIVCYAIDEWRRDASRNIRVEVRAKGKKGLRVTIHLHQDGEVIM